MSERRNGSPDGFSIDNFEAFVPGVRWRKPILTLRPSLVLRLFWWVSAIAFVGFIVLVIILLSASPGESLAVALLPGLIALVFAACVAGAIRTCVIATPSELMVRGWVTTRFYRWPDVSAFTIETDRRSVLGHVFGAPPSRPRLMAGARVDVDVPIARLLDGRAIQLYALISTSRSDGFSLGSASPAEIKTGILARYHANITNRPPTYTASE